MVDLTQPPVGNVRNPVPGAAEQPSLGLIRQERDTYIQFLYTWTVVRSTLSLS